MTQIFYRRPTMTAIGNNGDVIRKIVLVLRCMNKKMNAEKLYSERVVG